MFSNSDRVVRLSVDKALAHGIEFRHEGLNLMFYCPPGLKPPDGILEMWAKNIRVVAVHLEGQGVLQQDSPRRKPGWNG